MLFTSHDIAENIAEMPTISIELEMGKTHPILILNRVRKILNKGKVISL
jgi:hypothetical protein